ncbi:glutaminase [Yimella sp. cx-51]|uniref:glutaminase n=1 Tax=Yimella sp. cx-51 TaxID=2770551 RepID=UPI00165D8303|nr:glutaminase [Yimella sp. cx-51]MBC9956451.1 glutaminase [Yimella sp. cx-51]QTH38433.1 glutaminase [Yimella sp. cx-51]
MKTPVPDYLEEILRSCSDDTSGALADYIPELAGVDPDQLAVALCTTDGTVYSAGDADNCFTIQSISKAFVYALALQEHGVDAVLERIGVEPSGEAFNELSLEEGSGRPLNPMINAGALTCHALIGGLDCDPDERFEKVRAGLSAFAGRQLEVDEEVYASELADAYRNTAIANMLRSYEVIDGDPTDVVRGYIRQCSLRVTTPDLARMAATLANGGVQPCTGERVVDVDVVRQVLSVMMTCGMYDAAGDWMTNCGFPAKSGVSGGILGVRSGQVGLATFSPRLDDHGNSVRGITLCRRISRDMGLHIMEGLDESRSALRRDRRLRTPSGRIVRILSLQGDLRFSGAELVLREIAEDDTDLERLVLDLRRVSSIDRVAGVMLAEGLRRVREDGSQVTLADPERVLRVPDDHPTPDRVERLDEYRDLPRV